MKKISLQLLVAVVIFTVTALEVSAQEEKLLWNQLSETEKGVLQPYAGRWGELPPSQQHRLQKGARRWASLPPDERPIVQKRFRNWEKLNPEQRERIRSKFQQFQRLPQNKQDQLRRARHWFRNLPEEHKEKLRKKWQNIPPEKRSDWRLNRRQKIDQYQRKQLDRFNRNNPLPLPRAGQNRPTQRRQLDR